MTYTELDVRKVIAEIVDVIVDHPKSSQHAVHLVIDGKDHDITVTDVSGDDNGVTIWGQTR